MILKIKGQKVDYFNNFQVTMNLDSVASAFSFDFPFDPDRKDIYELVHVGHYHKMTIEDNNELLITGYILNHNFKNSNKFQLTSIHGYSLPGVLEDCEIPTSIYPLQSDGLSIREIASKMLAPFNIEMVIDPQVKSLMNSVLERSTASDRKKLKEYLHSLVAQKGVIMSHDEKGRLVFTRINTKQNPVCHFDGGIPGEEISLSFNGQAMHSHITVQMQASIDGGNAGESTVRNPFVPFVYRPRVASQSSGDDNDTAKAARHLLSEELKNIVVKVKMDRWVISGKIIRPGKMVSILDPKNYINKRTNFVVESVDLKGDENSQTATLTCVLPAVYDDSTPVNIFE